MKLGSLAVALFLAFDCAAQALEIIPLRHRTADQVIPVLRPLVEPGGTLSGQSNQLIIRTSPGNLADIRRALDAIDKPARRLTISVRFDGARDSSRQSFDASARVGSARPGIDVNVQDRSMRAGEQVDQRLQVLEGSAAFISSGTSRPVQQGFQEIQSGFSVIPRLSGDNVTLEIVQGRATPGPGGTAQTSQIGTVVRARLGEWTEIGGAAEQSARDQRALGSAASTRTGTSQAVWVRVEEMR
jgi:type II secretory pathway component GspD/PulD (secretin)